ncbi:DNA-processing protein DprA [Macrococcus sp. DPC7161]|uniref:DNA-processing protein DprA n=1 Tax=Macrococcus sp. DPC7161 TaxID=2507060 RepID=UPI00100A91FB|nr:DNA-processing protein DprA [Macrococcus sp. DPC7161]RXK18976.1 DNA-protecting protein DprA [Macrococcus sp. DPC7161]
MEKHHEIILKLIYSGFSSQQLHRFFRQYRTYHFNTNQFQFVLNNLFPSVNTKEKLERFNRITIEEIHDNLINYHVKICFFDMPEYPQQLLEIYDYPFVLFYKGDISYVHKKTLAIVGSRERTSYTVNVLESFMPKFIKNDIVIVSGLAKGTDSDAHLCAIHHHGKTIGVLGFGHGTHYPKETHMLRQLMEQTQLVISEYPPNAGVQKFRFPERNRIISGLSYGVFVTEAKARSGSLITVDQAIDQNKNVYCLPGDILNPHSMGCNLRINEGAKMVLEVQDILEDFNNLI